MRIEGVELRTVRMRLREPFRISSGLTHDRRILLIRLFAGGETGHGECVAGEAPNYSYETIETAGLVLERYLVPALLGRSLDGPAGVAAALNAAARGHAMAKAGLEMAAWELEARRQGVSLARLLGGERSAVPAGVSIGIQTDVDALLRRITGFVEEGYHRIKLKIAPGWDVDVIARVRRRFPDLPLMVDANAAYAAADADHLARLDAFALTMIEQPFPADDLLAHAALQRRVETPICLDESVTSPASCALALELGAARTVNIKPGRVGGFAASIAIHDLCREAGVPVWCGGMLESGIGRAHNVALASLPGFTLPGDTSASRRYWTRDIVDPPFELDADGCVRVPEGPGMGVAVDAAFLSSIEEERRDFGETVPG